MFDARPPSPEELLGSQYSVAERVAALPAIPAACIEQISPCFGPA